MQPIHLSPMQISIAFASGTNVRFFVAATTLPRRYEAPSSVNGVPAFSASPFLYLSFYSAVPQGLSDNFTEWVLKRASPATVSR